MGSLLYLDLVMWVFDPTPEQFMHGLGYRIALQEFGTESRERRKSERRELPRTTSFTLRADSVCLVFSAPGKIRKWKMVEQSPASLIISKASAPVRHSTMV